MGDEDKQMFLAEIGSGRTRPEPAGSARRSSCWACRRYFTAGVKEVRAWTIHIGDTARRPPVGIHTDFERGFIRPDHRLLTTTSRTRASRGRRTRAACAAKAKLCRQDGDVLNFLFNV